MKTTLPEYLFSSSTDGALYDTRIASWHAKRPLRMVFKSTFSEITNTAELKSTLRNGGFAWPGGYPLYFITTDGAALSFETVRKELRQVLWSIRTKVNDGWRVRFCEINYEQIDLTDAHTGQLIPSAYGDNVETAKPV